VSIEVLIPKTLCDKDIYLGEYTLIMLPFFVILFLSLGDTVDFFTTRSVILYGDITLQSIPISSISHTNWSINVCTGLLSVGYLGVNDHSPHLLKLIYLLMS